MSLGSYFKNSVWNRLSWIQRLFYLFITVMILLMIKESYDEEEVKQRELNETINIFYKISLPKQDDIIKVKIINRLGGIYSIEIYYKKRVSFDEEINYLKSNIVFEEYKEMKKNNKYLLKKNNSLIEISLQEEAGEIFLLDIVANRPVGIYEKMR